MPSFFPVYAYCAASHLRSMDLASDGIPPYLVMSASPGWQRDSHVALHCGASYIITHANITLPCLSFAHYPEVPSASEIQLASTMRAK